MTQGNRATGDAGETLAVRFLEKHGCRILCRNFKAQHGEIDVIAEKDAFLLFVEVKTRRKGGERGANAVDERKQTCLASAAAQFLAENRDNPYIASLKMRFDVVEIAFDKENRTASCRLLENAFTPDPSIFETQVSDRL